MAVNAKLFSTPAGHPMVFRLRPGQEKQRLRPKVDERGGLLTSAASANNSIALTEPGTVVWDNKTPYYLSSYIEECIKANRLLELDKFKVEARNSGSRQIVDAESDEEFNSTFKDKAKNALSKRKKYTTEEDTKIIQFIYDNRYIDGVRGISVWKTMEQAKIVEHSYQSLRDRFVKHIMPNLERYSLDDDCLTYMSRALIDEESSEPGAAAEPQPVRRGVQSDVNDGKAARRIERNSTKPKSDIKMATKRTTISSSDESSEKNKPNQVVRHVRRRRIAPAVSDSDSSSQDELVIVQRPAATRVTDKRSIISSTEATDTQCTAAVLAEVIGSSIDDDDDDDEMRLQIDTDEQPSPMKSVRPQVPVNGVVSSPEIECIENTPGATQLEDLNEEQAADLIRCLSKTHNYTEGEIMYFFTLVDGGVLDAISLMETGKTTQGLSSLASIAIDSLTTVAASPKTDELPVDLALRVTVAHNLSRSYE